MNQTTPNQPTNVTPTHASSSTRGWRRWWGIPATLLIIIGFGIVAYPFLPAIRYYVFRPKPTLPYQNNLSNTDAGQKALAQLPSLPTVQLKPIPQDNRLVIPSINVDMPILEGKTQKVLDLGGIWHIPNTSSPDKGGNTVLSGHRWEYLPPSSTTLYLLDKVQDGQPAIVYWHGQEYDYRITHREVVTPDRIDILNNTDHPQLTIFTCTPLFSTKQRLVLFGDLIS